MWRTQPITFVNAVAVSETGGTVESIRVKGARIDRIGGKASRGDAVIDLDGGVVFPGLINAHDHLELNSFARLKWRDRYANVREWIADFQPRFDTDPALAEARPDTLADRVWVGGLKNLLSGVTTVCHHNPIHRPLRSRFPVRIVQRFGLSHSLQIDGDRVAAAYRDTPKAWPWIIHAAEGVDWEAHGEVAALAAMGCLGPNSVLVHGVGIHGEHAEHVLTAGGALVWCPTSNEFLFGATANVRPFSERRRLAIGTDSRLSGEGDLLDELRAAHATGQVTARAAADAVTGHAAAILRLGRAGRLAPGAPADLTVLTPTAPDPFDTLARSRRTGVRLTMIDGAPLVVEERLENVFGACRQPFRRIRVDGSPRLLARWIASRAARLRLTEPGLEVEA
jgi:cytosine/adenosine deaminase-related metal-dependent hydrolase